MTGPALWRSCRPPESIPQVIRPAHRGGGHALQSPLAFLYSVCHCVSGDRISGVQCHMGSTLPLDATIKQKEGLLKIECPSYSEPWSHPAGTPGAADAAASVPFSGRAGDPGTV